LIISVNAGSLTITEDARAGYVVSDVYTIPAGRLISKNLTDRSVQVTIVPGTADSQTIVVFVNQAVSTQIITDAVSNASWTDVRLSENVLDTFMQILTNSVRS
jgi:3-keto-L-gulonate-6-phosphate decarboxylase